MVVEIKGPSHSIVAESPNIITQVAFLIDLNFLHNCYTLNFILSL